MLWLSMLTGSFNQIPLQTLELANSEPDKFPLIVITGNVGTGKSKTLKDFQNSSSLNQSIKFFTSYSLINEYIESIKNVTYDKFQNSIREVDILLIDDFHMLVNRTATQAMILDVLKFRFEHRKLSIITSVFDIIKIKKIIPTLRSFASSALVCSINGMNIEERAEYALYFAKGRRLTIRPEVSFLIAESCSGFREIQGAILKIEATSKFLNVDINLENVKKCLSLKS